MRLGILSAELEPNDPAWRAGCMLDDQLSGSEPQIVSSGSASGTRVPPELTLWGSLALASLNDPFGGAASVGAGLGL